MKDQDQFIGQIEQTGLYLNERLGQHFLIDPKVISTLSNSVIGGDQVIEIGSGIGHITKALAQRAGSVVGIEIDRRFQPYLEKTAEENEKISFIYGDVLKMDLSRFIHPQGGTQVIANLPFHITEPFLYKLVDLRIDNAVLLLGDEAVREFEENETRLNFGKMSLVVQTFFNAHTIMPINRSSFYPQPRTDACLVTLEPKSKKEIGSNPADFILAELIRKERKNGLVLNDFKQAIVELKTSLVGTSLSKREFHQRERANTRRELRMMTSAYRGGRYQQEEVFQAGGTKIASQVDALRVIAEMGISDSVLNKPFFRLDNQDLRELVMAVRAYY